MGINYSTNSTDDHLKFNKDISFKSNHFVNHQYESTILVYYHPKEKEKDLSLELKLRKLILTFIYFNDFHLCQQWLNNQSIYKNIILIINDHLDDHILLQFIQIPSILSINIKREEQHFQRKSTVNHSRIHFHDSLSHSLFKQIEEDYSLFHFILIDESIQIFQNNSSTNPFFVYLIVNLLLSNQYLHQQPNSNKFFSKVHQSYPNDQFLFNQMEELMNNIPKRSLLNIINKSLKDENIQFLFDIRFILLNIFKQIQLNHLNSIKVYQKQILSFDKLNQIKLNVNNYLIINSFFLTETQIPSFASNKFDYSNNEKVIFHIDANYTDQTTLFTFTNSNQDQVVFICGSTFQIKSIQEDSDRTSIIHLTLISSQQFYSFEQNDYISKYFPLIDQLNESNLFYSNLLNEYPLTDPTLHLIQDHVHPIQPSTSFLFSIFFIYRMVR